MEDSSALHLQFLVTNVTGKYDEFPRKTRLLPEGFFSFAFEKRPFLLKEATGMTAVMRNTDECIFVRALICCMIRP